MDLNYWYYRQQVERIRADAAPSDVVRSVHQQLASEYEKKIGIATKGRSGLARSNGIDNAVVGQAANPTMAIAVTVRQFVAGR